MTFTGWETLAGRRKALPLGHVTLGSGACSVQDPCAHGLFDLIQLTDSLLSVRNLESVKKSWVGECRRLDGCLLRSLPND